MGFFDWFKPKPKPTPAPAPSTNPISMAASKWAWAYSQGMPATAVAVPNGFAFDFPRGEGGTKNSVHYLRQLVSIKGQATQRLRMVLYVTADPGALFNEKIPGESNPGGTMPPNVRLYFNSPNGGGSGDESWWSNPVCYVMAPGSAVLEVSLDPANWSNTHGQFGTSRLGFTRARETIQFVGMTFGGGNDFGHGVNVLGGNARLTVTEYAVL